MSLVAPKNASIVSRERFLVAGLEVALECRQRAAAPQLLGSYQPYISSNSPPNLVIELDRIPGFEISRHPGSAHPGFDCRTSTGRILLSRWDAEGEIHLPTSAGAPIVARFRTSENPHSVEATVRAAFSIALPRHSGLILHASAVIYGNGHTLLFAGPSGAGKSTLARLLATAPWHCRLLSDELLIIRRGPDGWQAHSAPFHTSAPVEHRATGRLRALHFLSQASAHARLPLTRGQAVAESARNVLAYLADPITASHVLDLVDQLARDVPAHQLLFAKDPDVGKVLEITCGSPL